MKDKIISISFTSFLIIIFLLNIIIKDQDISYTERRKLTQFPIPSLKTIADGSYFSKFSEYSTDQMLLRDEFRSIKAFTSLYLYKKLDNNNLVLKDNYIYKLNNIVNEKSVNNFIDTINFYKNKFKKSNIYISLIPDKSYFLDSKYIKLDNDYFVSKVINNIDANFINIIPYLSIDDYYKTDTHWKQESITNIANNLAKSMNTNIDNKYDKSCVDNFYGVYYGQLGLKVKPDSLCYLTNHYIKNAQVNYLETSYDKVYNVDKLDSKDYYDIYLNGANALITISNSLSKNKKELIIFRDSFGSSIVPLLISGYSKITVVDIRYINYDNLKNYIDFNTQNVLFLYSESLINDSFTLKK